MSDTKVLQAILDGQVAIREDIKRVDNKVDKNGERIDKFGLQLAELSDDAPTIKEFDKLGKRVTNLEKTVASN